MKELSIEEKAKRYDEAIKIAKSKIKNDKDHVLYEDDIIEILPELKESNDERIRKAIITTIHLYYGEPLEDDAKEMIVWLEKQGEYNPTWSEEDEDYFDAIIAKLEVTQDDAALTDNQMEFLKSLKDKIQSQNGYNPYKEVVESIAEMCKHYDKANHSGLRDFYDNVKVKCKMEGE